MAEALFLAATDNTPRLRYLVGEDAEALGMIAREYGLPELAPDGMDTAGSRP